MLEMCSDINIIILSDNNTCVIKSNLTTNTLWNLSRLKKLGPFGNVILIILFVFFKNTYR